MGWSLHEINEEGKLIKGGKAAPVEVGGQGERAREESDSVKMGFGIQTSGGGEKVNTSIRSRGWKKAARVQGGLWGGGGYGRGAEFKRITQTSHPGKFSGTSIPPDGRCDSGR